jgi:cytochrome c oxidase subunit III
MSPAKAGLLCFLVSEVAFFSTLILAYAWYLEPIRTGDPKPSDVFSWAIVIPATLCLLTSSVTVHFAEMALHRGNRGLFSLLWGATILLGVGFLSLTAMEWRELIYDHGLTPNRNLFGSCYFTLVGFHAFHVTLGVIMLTAVLGLVLRRRIDDKNTPAPVLVSWYWHFVDVVWLAVLTLVYVVGR